MKVLVIRLSSLGDVALASAVLDGLRGHELTLLTYEPFGGLYRHDPRVRVLEVPRGIGFRRLLGLIRGRFDWVLDLHSKPLTLALSLAARPKRLARYRKRVLERRLAVWLRRKIGFKPVHELYCEAAERLVGKEIPCKPKLFPPPSGPSVPENAVVLAPGARSPARRWARFGELAEALEGLGYAPVWVGLEGEGRGWPGVNLLGKTSVPELLWVVSRARALVSGDTGVLHVARGLGVPAVALFGPTVPELGFGLLPEEGVNLGKPLACRPCALHGNPRSCPYEFKCLKEITVQEVLESLLPLLKG